MSRATVNRASRAYSVTISSGVAASPVSDSFACGTGEFVGVQLSTAFSGTALTFQVGPSSSSAGSWYDLYLPNTTQVSVTVSTAASRAYVVSPDQSVFAPWPFARLVSNSTGETAGRTITVYVK